MSKILTGMAVLALSASVAVPAASAASFTTSKAAASAAVAPTGDLRAKVDQALAKSKLSAKDQATIRRIVAKLPAGATQMTRGGALGDAGNSDWTASRNGAIDPSQYQCASTPVSDWLDSQLDNVDFLNLLLLNYLGALDLPTYDALVFGQESHSNTFGYDGSYTNELNHTMRDLKGFWDIKSDDISLIPMHGKPVFSSDARTARSLQVLGYDAADSAELAPIIREMVTDDPALKGGDHPIFTFNAFAYTNEGDPDPLAATISDRIVMGDGVMAGMKAIGLDKTAPRSVLAHEFGHHVQFEDNLFDSPLTGPEATRRTELMADSFGSYFLAHKKGASLNKHRVLEDEQSFYNVGDCAYTSNSHHGTPNQRLRAATWGVDTAAAAKPASYVLPSLTLAGMFEKQLPVFVAPDAK